MPWHKTRLYSHGAWWDCMRPCPTCRHKTMTNGAGGFRCDVCGWGEKDGVQLTRRKGWQDTVSAVDPRAVYRLNLRR